MSTTPDTSERVAPALNKDDDHEFPSKWIPPIERPPTEVEEARARTHNLNIGNKTEIGYDVETELYKPKKHSKNIYQRLDRHNRDNHWKYREDVNTAQDYDRQLKLKAALAIGSQLGLSDLHKQTVVDRLFEIDGRRFGERNEVVAFCLCAIVVNKEAEKHCEDDEDTTVYHPARRDVNNDSEFARVETQLLEAFGDLTEPRLHSIYAKLKQGRPPLREDEQTRRFVNANTDVQRRPSFAPMYSLPHPTKEA